MQTSKAAKTLKTTNRRSSIREKKMALQQDVDKLRKKLRYEENVHRALARAFTRPLGALPRLPPYLPQNTLELLAEVAVLEEEVIRLEEQLMTFREGLYQEAVYISSSKKPIENVIDPYDFYHNKAEQAKSLPKTSELETVMGRPPTSRNDDSRPSLLSSGLAVDQIWQCPDQPVTERRQSKKEQSSSALSARGRDEEQSIANMSKHKQSPQRRSTVTRIPVKKRSAGSKSMEKLLNPLKLQEGNQSIEQEREGGNPLSNTTERVLNESYNISCPNKISEDVLKCLSSIFLGMGGQKVAESEFDSLSSISGSSSYECPEGIEVQDPYNMRPEFGRRDIGPYKNMRAVEGSSVDRSRVVNFTFLRRRMKMLFGKLTSVDLQNLNHQQKLAFWINIYNTCMMNAFLEYGIPESPQMVVALMRKAMINIGGHSLNAMKIEHFILRIPYNSKSTHTKYAKNDEISVRSIFGLEWPEPLVTFALSCGSWSSPAIRVYTASQVENQLQEAKRDYLQAAVGICATKFAIPKLLDWYLLDFAKDLESLLDWICLQLPCEARKEALRCLETGRRDVRTWAIQVIPYEFNFRYLLAPW